MPARFCGSIQLGENKESEQKQEQKKNGTEVRTEAKAFQKLAEIGK